jgi:hypothetical protein
MWKPYHYAMLEAVETFILYPTYMLYTHVVFKHLTITTTDISPDSGQLAKILGDLCVETMPLHYG